jgi:protein-disulfide isomerase
VRALLLSVAVVDDLVSLVVIGAVYSKAVVLAPLGVAAGIFAVILILRPARIRGSARRTRHGTVTERAAPAALPSLDQLRHRPAVRARQRRHPAQRRLPRPRLHLAITLGILIGYVAGKPLGITGASWLLTRLSRGRLRPPVGWATVAGVGTIAGIGFAVSILIATLAFTGTQLQEAKLGILSTVLAAPAATWLVFRAVGLLPARLQVRALLGTAQVITDLGAAVDPARDLIRGPARAPVTIVEYGDFECPYCGQAEPVLREMLAGHGDVRYVWRHLPLNDVHPDAQLAAEAAEAAADQDAFWEMHDLLLQHQDALQPRDLMRYASDRGLDSERFGEHLRKRAGAARIAEDVDTAALSRVTGTPTFFINGRRLLCTRRLAY